MVEGGGYLSKGRFPAHSDKQGLHELLQTEVGGWLHAETSQSALTVILKLVLSGLTNIILVV